MSSPTFETIESLIASQEVRGTSVAVTFRAPGTDQDVESSATIQRSNSMQATATRSAKKNMWSSLRRTITKTISEVFGKGVAGKVARDVSNAAVKQTQDKTAFSKPEIQDAIVQAFVSVQDRFTWNEDSSTWSAASSDAPVKQSA